MDPASCDGGGSEKRAITHDGRHRQPFVGWLGEAAGSTGTAIYAWSHSSPAKALKRARRKQVYLVNNVIQLALLTLFCGPGGDPSVVGLTRSL